MQWEALKDLASCVIKMCELKLHLQLAAKQVRNLKMQTGTENCACPWVKAETCLTQKYWLGSPV